MSGRPSGCADRTCSASRAEKPGEPAMRVRLWLCSAEAAAEPPGDGLAEEVEQEEQITLLDVDHRTLREPCLDVNQNTAPEPDRPARPRPAADGPGASASRLAGPHVHVQSCKIPNLEASLPRRKRRQPRCRPSLSLPVIGNSCCQTF